ncbi:PREDICTED: lymphokine-activated killer T-cell-originated protein kinase [Sturnus vulgaris]|uniref:lymphokine-activated killer T-cell-originated protein kinase n=1 Tax=Sturnus vulgaris TaxID=9172 RepID=UPI00071A4DC9|nr:PREDICTED: lymphokine-activated killer T-cell-originated protein kinase [Sturnus vulgaris]
MGLQGPHSSSPNSWGPSRPPEAPRAPQSPQSAPDPPPLILGPPQNPSGSPGPPQATPTPRWPRPHSAHANYVTAPLRGHAPCALPRPYVVFGHTPRRGGAWARARARDSNGAPGNGRKRREKEPGIHRERIGIGIGVGSMDTFQSPTPSSRRDKADAGAVSVTIPASPFMQKLGFGTGVSVYLMKRSPQGLSRSPWAVKKINSGCSQSQRSLFQRRLREEAQKLRKLQHPNIVGYRALTEAPDGSLCLAMEFGGEKSLNDLIEERREQGLGAFPAPTILHVALSMARGLQYLHTEQRLLHGDIKSPNVVVRGAFDSVKICDVGVSLPLDENLEVPEP